MARLVPALVLSIICFAAHAAPIGDILANPRNYADRTVIVEGEVQSAFSFVLVKTFTVNDGSGTITVVTTQPLPRKGERIRVFGKVKEVFSFGSESLVMLFEQEEPSVSV